MRVLGTFIVVIFVSILVLQWWFCNKFCFRDFDDFFKLGDQGAHLWPFDLERNVVIND
jgi:hypothetical protein